MKIELKIKMLATLQRKLYMDDERFEKFLQWLDDSGSVIAGSFPLVWACEPTPKDWHHKTRTEVLTLALVGEKLGCRLPQLALEAIGNWIQVSELVEDMKNDRADIDIFHSQRVLVKPIGWEELPVDANGLYALHKFKIGWTNLFQQGTTRLNFIAVNGDPQSFVDSFDYSFCRVTLNTNRPVPMRGTISLANYREALAYIRERLQDLEDWRHEGHTLPGLSSEEFCALIEKMAEEIRQRWAKYDRRRFVVDNLQELEDFVAQLE